MILYFWYTLQEFYVIVYSMEQGIKRQRSASPEKANKKQALPKDYNGLLVAYNLLHDDYQKLVTCKMV